MTDQLISFETAKLAKKVGFFIEDSHVFDTENGRSCISIGRKEGESDSEYDQRVNSIYNVHGLPVFEKTADDLVLMVTQSLLAKWLRDEHKVYVTVVRETLGSDEWEWAYHVEWLPKEHWGEKRRCGFFQYKNSFQESPGGTYWGAWPTYEQALEEGLVLGLRNLLAEFTNAN